MGEVRDYKLTEEQKRLLFRIGMEEDGEGAPGEGEDQKQDMLFEALGRSLPVEAGVLESLPEAVQEISREMTSVAGATLEELLQSEGSEMTEIVRVKRYAKEKGGSAESEAEREVFMAIYLGAIAYGLVYHGRKASKHSLEDLAVFFRRFSEKEWLPGWMAALLRRGMGSCERGEMSSEENV